MLRLNGIKSLTVEARSNVLQAAGYTTRRYVKLLRWIVEAPFSVCPALCGSPPTKCSSALALYWCEGGIPLGRSVLREYPATSTHFRFGQRGPGRAVPSLSSLPCWVVPLPKTRLAVSPTASSLASPLRGTASPCLSIPARHSPRADATDRLRGRDRI